MSHPPDQSDLKAAVEEGIRAVRDRGDALDLGLLVNTYRPYLLRMAASRLSRDIAIKFAPSDAVQETMLQATRDFPQFRGASENELRQWLQTILLRNISDVNRKYWLADKRKVSQEVRVDSSTGLRVKNGLTSRDPSPSAGLRREESSIELQLAICRLSEDQQSIIRLRNFDKLSFDEIGRKINRTSNAARKLWCRAIERLAQELEAHDVDPARPE